MNQDLSLHCCHDDLLFLLGVPLTLHWTYRTFPLDGTVLNPMSPMDVLHGHANKHQRPFSDNSYENATCQNNT